MQEEEEEGETTTADCTKIYPTQPVDRTITTAKPFVLSVSFHPSA
jgi:hypothetical protein